MAVAARVDVERVLDGWTLRVALVCDGRLIARRSFDTRHDDTDAEVARWLDQQLDRRSAA